MLYEFRGKNAQLESIYYVLINFITSEIPSTCCLYSLAKLIKFILQRWAKAKSFLGHQGSQ